MNGKVARGGVPALTQAKLLHSDQLREKIIAANRGPLNVADPVQFAAEEYICAHAYLDSLGVPRDDSSRAYQTTRNSLVERIRLAIAGHD